MTPTKDQALSQLLDQLEKHPDDRLVDSLQNTLIESAQASQRRLAYVQTAVPVTHQESARITALIQSRFPQIVNIDFTVAPEIISGIKIQVGDQLLDDSGQTTLNQMKKSLLS